MWMSITRQPDYLNPFPVNQGWVCPKCRRGVSPYTNVCPCTGVDLMKTQSSKPIIYWTLPDSTFPTPVIFQSED